ncbi:MAG: thioredoxin family protein, partial [Planctomycetaceae bacterium]|nr:thioredoxin family protein [Planctomycetaceae bacterium]
TQEVGGALLEPTYSATGRLLKADGTVWAGAKVRYSVKVSQEEIGKSPWRPSFGSFVITDEEGRYTLEHLILRVEYDVDVEFLEDESWSPVTKVLEDEPKSLDLGDTRVAERSGTQPLKDRVVAAFSDSTPLTERLAAVKHKAERDDTRIAVIVAAPDSKEAEWFYRLLRGTGDDCSPLKIDEENLGAIRSGMNDFRQMWVRADQFNELRTLISDNELEEDHRPALILLDTDGSWLCHFEPDLQDKPGRAVKSLQAAIEHQQLPDRDAAEILAAAKQQATREGKRILLQETAAWCGPCHLLSRFIEQHKAIFDKYFVWIKIDRDRMNNADAVMQPIRLGNSRSIPWIAVLDADGNVLDTSTTMSDELRTSLLDTAAKLTAVQDSLGAQHLLVKALQRRLELLNEDIDANTFGFPTEPMEAIRFLEMLRETVPAITKREYGLLWSALRKNMDSASESGQQKSD